MERSMPGGDSIKKMESPDSFLANRYRIDSLFGTGVLARKFKGSGWRFQ